MRAIFLIGFLFYINGAYGHISSETNTAWTVFDTRINRGAAVAFCATTDSCLSGQVESREFPNGNTFVQVKSQLANRNVMVVVPPVMDSDVFMEVLLTVFTAHTWGARTIDVRSDLQPTVRSLSRPLFDAGQTAQWLALAGATHLSTPTEVLTLEASAIARGKVPSSIGPTVVVSLHHEELGARLAESLGLRHLSLEKLKDEEWPRHRQVIFLSVIDQPTNQKLFDSLVASRRLKQLSNKVIQIVPYLPYVRSDKIDQPGVAVGGKLVADMLESTGIDMIGFVKLHAAQAQGFFRIPTLHIGSKETITAELQRLGIEAVVSPDAGFQKEARTYATELGLPVHVLDKIRDPISGLSSLGKMGSYDVQGKTLAVIDDETASGSTLADAAKFLKSEGAKKVFGFVTHLAGNAAKAKSSEFLDVLYVTDTFPVAAGSQGARLRSLSMVEEMAKSLMPFIQESCEFLLRRNLGPEEQ